MARAIKILILAFAVPMLYACGTLKDPVVVKNSSISDYKYVYITPTKELSSSTSGAYMGQNGVMYGSTESKSVNPSDVIAGALIKKGFIIIPELSPELQNKTLIMARAVDEKRDWGIP